MTAAARIGAVLALGGIGLSGCGAHTAATRTGAGLRALERQARPVGTGPRFRPPASRRVRGACRPALDRRYPIHLELFAADRVVIVPAGIGVAPPRRQVAGRITAGGCFGDLVTLDPTGVVLVGSGRHLTLASVFAAWRQPLSVRRVAGFRSRRPVRAYVNGHRWRAGVGTIPLTPHAEIVVETGPYVAPHAGYVFPPLRL